MHGIAFGDFGEAGVVVVEEVVLELFPGGGVGELRSGGEGELLAGEVELGGLGGGFGEAGGGDDGGEAEEDGAEVVAEVVGVPGGDGSVGKDEVEVVEAEFGGWEEVAEEGLEGEAVVEDAEGAAVVVGEAAALEVDFDGGGFSVGGAGVGEGGGEVADFEAGESGGEVFGGGVVEEEGAAGGEVGAGGEAG